LCPDRKRVTKKVSGGEITNYGDNPRKKLLAVTLVTVLSIVAVVSVYAVIIGTFQGLEVTVGGAQGSIGYSADNVEPGSWTETLDTIGVGVAWYARFEIPTGGYSGPVTITWQLQNKTGALTWADIADASESTSVVFTGSDQNVYATSLGAITGNHDWGADFPRAGTYRVIVQVNSA
jgi:hypothetical protein